MHTRYSFDAFIFGTIASADDAYEFAKGGAIQHPAGFELKLDRPLDFQAVTDHGMYLGMLPGMDGMTLCRRFRVRMYRLSF